jgi:hypothetical protein
MSKYKMNGRTASKLNEYWYKVIDGNGLNLYDIPASYIEDEGFGWEKVEEPFKEGSWYYFELDHYLQMVVRYKDKDDIELHYSEAYGIGNGGSSIEWVNDKCSLRDIKGPATKEQMELCLGHVTRHKGYKEGLTRVCFDGKTRDRLKGGEFKYDPELDEFWMGRDLIYCVRSSKGTWATILPEKSTEPEDDMKNIVPMYIADLGEIHCNELRFIIERFLDQNHDYKNEVEKWRKIEGKVTEPQVEGKDWKTAKVFSYEAIYELASILEVGEEVLYVIPKDDLEEEAKKRTQL